MTDHVGQKLGNYRLVRLLGQGGFAEVYLGQHVFLDTQAAIKVLHTRLESEDIAPFLNEARTVARLAHPNIVRVLEFGVEGDIPYLVVDYAPNGTMRKRYPRGTRLPLNPVVYYVMQLATALQYAHEQKVIHRDIKPENILIGRHNELLISDFGIALISQSSRYESTQGMQEIAGTVAYMAPEQIQSQAVPASDQYALAVVVYEWICGDRPFHGSFTEIAVKHTMVPPPSLREKVPTLPEEVEKVIMKALAKDPKERYPSILDFALALEEAYRQTASPEELSNDFNAGRSRPLIFPSPVSGSLSSDSAPLPVEGNQVDLAPRPPENRDLATTPMPTETSSLYEHPVKTGDKSTSVLIPPARISRRTALLGLAGLAVAGAAGLGTYILTHQSSASHSPPARGPNTQALYTFRGHSMWVWSAAWAPGQPRIVSASSDTTAQVWNAADGNNRVVYHGHKDSVYCAAWSPNGQRIASCGYDQTVQVWDAGFGDQFYVYKGHTSWVWTTAWSPDGQRLASAGGDLLVHVWDAADGGNRRVFSGHSGPVYSLAWSPDGLRLASASADGSVILWNVSNGQVLYTYQPDASPLWAISWSPDGNRLAVAGDDQTVQIWDAVDGAYGDHLFVYHGHTDFVYAVSWSPDSKRIASGGADKTVQVWNPADGTLQFTYNGHTDDVRSLSWSGDGKQIASASLDQTVQVWKP
ncbi:MAG TPA: serine/threonine-protein kinase [Ktedonobacteraceae bacterium]|nr:serine/threonine-protein kinase [Ktedonobacteraceae bacterium]